MVTEKLRQVYPALLTALIATMTRNNGWIYCMTNASMPGIYKVGMTRRKPDERLAEANTSDTWRPPTPYVIEYALRTGNLLETERNLHTLLVETGGERVHQGREFFRMPLKEIKHLMNNVAVAVTDDDVVVIDSDEDDPYYHPSVMPKKAREPPGAAERMHLRSGRLVK